MPYTPVSGTFGRIRLVKVAAAPTTPAYSWSGTTVAKAGMTSWKINDARAGGVPSVMDFESPVDSEGVAYPTPIRGGTAEMPKLEIEGIIDIDPTTGTTVVLPNNAAVVVDALLNKHTSKGYVGMPCVMESFRPGIKIDDKTATFSATLAISGPPASYLSL